jgi:hypothetical protein
MSVLLHGSEGWMFAGELMRRLEPATTANRMMVHWSDECVKYEVGKAQINTVINKLGNENFIFWYITLCNPLNVNRCFGETFRPRLQETCLQSRCLGTDFYSSFTILALSGRVTVLNLTQEGSDREDHTFNLGLSRLYSWTPNPKFCNCVCLPNLTHH